MHKCLKLAPLLAVFSILTGTAHGSELVYEFKSPNFGGNPLYGDTFLNYANAQNDHKDPDDPSEKSDLERFNDQLQRSVLSRISSAIAGSVIGPTGDLQPGVVETVDFTIVIVDVGGGLLELTTTDRSTGDTVSFQVDSGF